MMSPGRKMQMIKEEFKPANKSENAANENIYEDSLYLSLLKEKSFMQSKIAMAGTDSIYLTLNLPDSTINIEISGVLVHSAKMSKISTSMILVKGKENIILNMLASPFTISKRYSTIRKDPLMIKMAPKDTSEYKPDIMPDTSITKPVNYILEMTNGTRIYIYQEEKDKPGFRSSQFLFDLKDRLRNTLIALKSIAVFKVPEYHPYIKLRIRRADAEIIYRALPVEGQIAVLL